MTLTAIVELLSIIQQLAFTGLLLAWIVVVALQAVVYIYIIKSNKHDAVDASRTEKNRVAATDKVLFSCVVVVLVSTGVTALIAPPNNWDSMTYHMSRVMHWIQGRSVAHFPTSILRQIELNPWAEFAITNFQILIGSDRLANLVQWSSMVGCVLGVSLLAERFGADRRGQLFAALAAATIPMGILQSSTTQNDIVVAFWLVPLNI